MISLTIMEDRIPNQIQNNIKEIVKCTQLSKIKVATCYSEKVGTRQIYNEKTKHI